MGNTVKVFTTRGSEDLALKICKILSARLTHHTVHWAGSATKVEKFSNENLQVQVDNVRGCFVVVIHTQTPPVNENIIELFALLDAICNARPADILLVFPYMPYARSDRKNKPRISTMGHRLPHILTQSFDIRRVLLLDPHDTHTKHYFEPVADEISSIYLFADYIQHKAFFVEKNDLIMVFADAGAAKRFGPLAHLVGLPVAYIDKDRPDDTERPAFKKVVGEVRNQVCLLVDDEILTGGTVLGDMDILMRAEARQVFMFAIHAILTDKRRPEEEVMQRLENSAIGEFVITDSIPVHHKVKGASKFKILSIAPLLAEAIKREIQDESLTDLHQYKNVEMYRPDYSV